jgi:hypothetical protein
MALASRHSRYITATPERALVSVGEWPLHTMQYNRYNYLTVLVPKRYVTAVSLIKPPCGGFRSKTATRNQEWFKI